MDKAQTNRKLAAILFSDIVDCTKIISKDEALGLDYIRQHSLIVNENVDKFNGKLLKELGDGCLLIFDSTYDAIKFSNHIQEIINVQKDFKIRIGIHVGDIIKEGDDYLGSGVNIASRIHAFANPGETCFTQDVYSQIKSHTEITSELMGKKDIKGISDKMEIFKIISEKEVSIKTDKPQRTLISEINNRRVPQFLGFYAAAAWTLIQFVDWLTIRYQYSPHLVDLSLGIVLSMIPSIIILSYFHGAPGKDKWNRIERIGIPLNIVVSVIVMAVFFYPKDLGATTKTVTYEDEDGNNIERVIPKVEFRKNILLYNFTIDDNIEEWMSSGVPSCIAYKMLQDIYVNSSFQFEIESILGEYNKSITDIIPFSLQREISKKQNKQFFLNGSIGFNDDVFTIKTKLYNTKSSKIVSEQSFDSENIYELIDKLSFSIRNDLGIPEKHLDENIDLPAIEVLPNSIESMKQFIKGQIKEGDGGGQAIPYFEKAVEIDETCAVCYLKLQNAYVMNNQGDKRLGAIKKALEYDYKLPERLKFLPKIMLYWETQQPDKMIKVAEMQIQLYPENLIGYEVLAELYRNKSEHLKQIEQYKSILKQFEGKLEDNKDIANYLLKIADIYLYRLADYAATKKAVDKYVYYYPESSPPYGILAKMYSYQGNTEKAIEMYETALTFDRTNINNMIDLEWIRDGGVNRIENIENILKNTTSMHDSATVYLAMARLNREYGMLSETIKNNDKALRLKESYQQFMHYSHIYYWNAANYAKIGQYDKGYKIIEDIGKTLQKPFSEFAVVRTIGYHIDSENWDKLNEMIPQIKEMALSYGIEFEDVLFSEGYVHEYLHKNYLKAIEYYNQYLNIKANRYADIHIAIARCYRLNKDFKSALKKLDEIKNSDLLYKWDANYEYALLYQDKGNIKKAINHIDLMLEHYKHADPTLIKVNRAKTLKEDLDKL